MEVLIFKEFIIWSQSKAARWTLNSWRQLKSVNTRPTLGGIRRFMGAKERQVHNGVALDEESPSTTLSKEVIKAL